jgi:4-hydroxy-tetrahydrodipicolinate synthase
MLAGAADLARGLIWSAAPTPFLDDGSLDHASIERLVAQHARLGVEGYFLGGTCGEGPFMPTGQRAELLRRVRATTGAGAHLAVQVSDTSSPRVRENVERAVAAGADSVVIAAPWLTAFVNPGFARRYFFESLDRDTAVPIGIYVLRQPPATGLDVAFWAEVVSHPNVAYVKDSSGLAEYRRALLAVKAARPGLVLRTGDEFDVLSAIGDGYDGCILGTAVLNARLLAQAIAALGRGDGAAAARLQARSNAFLYDLFRPDIVAWMSGLKYALHRLGILSTEYAYLVDPLDDDDRRRIDAALEREKEWY